MESDGNETEFWSVSVFHGLCLIELNCFIDHQVCEVCVVSVLLGDCRF